MYENKIEDSSSLFPIVNLNDENDQFNQFLYSNDIILPFFNNNPYFVETYKVFIFNWSVDLSKFIRENYNRKNSN